MNVHHRPAAPPSGLLHDLLASGLAGDPHPLYPGAVAVIVRGGVMEPPVAVGNALRYADSAGTELPLEGQDAMRGDTLFDVASLTKLFTATVLMSMVEDGMVGLDAPVADRLPSFTSHGRRSVTLRHLLTHTSGLPALLRLWVDEADVPSRRRAVLDAPLENEPGRSFVYSDVGYLVAGFLVEEVGGRSLPELVGDRVCAPLGLGDTGYRTPTADPGRVAATEDESYVGRGMVRGQVHDENSWSLGGSVGHAGIFSTASDIATFGEAVRRGGILDGARLLREASVAEMLRDQLPADVDPGFRQGIGFRIADPSFMGGLALSGAVGHTGFTGGSLVIDPTRELVVVLLTNRVHPSRHWSDISEMRRRTAEIVAGADGAPGSVP